ncbi:polysaccharide synthesis protein GtrA [Lactococcus hodotermopsidis]|uniref:Polysaccharide synthesis protein GtrA n=1 Tax=Pseudolactococcus hodotermopsidis TaxID=2709157 RepID=A0A6A0BDX5_9LACT|nr:GtrA family protein [Lactococcus hodotermopsidis]GFH42885.1 polysaccharide synthesis protein GtrA [Lactococcus hodotermopsidis]
MKKIFNNQIFKYLVAGILATVVYFVIKMLTFALLQNGVLSELLAQLTAIIFAFVTNKFWVFEKTENSLLSEFVKFTVSRLFVMFISVAANWYFVDTNPSLLTDTFHLSRNQAVFVLSLILQVLTIILNYIFSKFLIFTEKIR